MSTVLASAADRRYGWYLLNLIGSIHANSPGTFDAVVVYDLGLSPRQRRLASSIRGAELRTVPEFVPHWREGRTWKAWIWRHLEADRLVWLDAGMTVLRSLDAALTQIDERDYWAVSQNHPIGMSTPSDYWERFGVDPALAQRDTIWAGGLGFARPSRFFDEVIVPTYEDCLKGFSVGLSAGEENRNHGLDYNPTPPIRDCAHFRHEQTVLNLRFHAAYDDPLINDFDRWAGSKTSHDHPEQVIWAHRRRGDFRFLGRVPYTMPFALLGTPVGLAVHARWWLRLHRWLFRPSTYSGKARRVVAGSRRGGAR